MAEPSTMNEREGPSVSSEAEWKRKVSTGSHLRAATHSDFGSRACTRILSTDGDREPATSARSEQREHIAQGDDEQHQRREDEDHESHGHEIRRALDQRVDDAHADVAPREPLVERIRDTGQMRVD